MKNVVLELDNRIAGKIKDLEIKIVFTMQIYLNNRSFIGEIMPDIMDILSLQLYLNNKSFLFKFYLI